MKPHSTSSEIDTIDKFEEMIPIRTTTIPISPRTHVRSTRNETWLLSHKITYEYLEKLDIKRFEAKGKKGTLASRKRQLEINKDNQMQIAEWVIENRFKMPLGHFAVWFYVPVTGSWRQKKVKEMLYTVHQSTPDLDNYLKQLFDSVMPRRNKQVRQRGCDDRKIFCYAAFKMWVRAEEACIKILEYDELEFMKSFEHGLPYYSK